MRKDGPGAIGGFEKPQNYKTQMKAVDNTNKADKAVTEYFQNTAAKEPTATKKAPAEEHGLIMMPVYLKQQSRLEKNIKDLNQQVEYARKTGDEESAVRYETQISMYKTQLDECKKNIEEKKIEIAEDMSISLDTEEPPL